MTKEEKDAYTKYKLEKADETLLAAKVLAKEKLWTSVINRLYYASFYAVTSLMVDYEIASKTHKTLKSEFNREFIRSGAISKESGVLFNALFKQRHRGDYDDFVEFSEGDVIPLISRTERLIQEVRIYLKSK